MFNRIKLSLAAAVMGVTGKAPVSLQRDAAQHNRTVDVVREAVTPNMPMRNPPLHLRGHRGIGGMLDGWAARIVGRRQIVRSKMHWGPNGAQECARRVRQIERGQLTRSNGLLVPGGCNDPVAADSNRRSYSW